MSEFKGKVAFITGAASGIGRASGIAFAREGAKVMLVDVEQTRLEETLRMIVDEGGQAAMMTADVSSAASVQAAVEETLARFSGLDCAHNNAGILGPNVPFLEYPADAARKLFEVNVMGVFHCMQAQLRCMLSRGGGAIVNTASVSGFRATPGISAYTTSKHAVIGLSKAAALEYSGQGVRINTICPGFVQTRMVGDFFSPELDAAIKNSHPIGRVCQPEEIAEAALWLCSRRASYVSGTNLIIDGAQTTH